MQPEFPKTCKETCEAALRWLSPAVAMCINEQARHKWYWDGRRLVAVMDPAIIDLALEIRRLERVIEDQDRELEKLRPVANAAVERQAAELRAKLASARAA